MTLDLLFPNFADIIHTPADVKNLNQMILELAVRGKLVPQDPTDEPVDVLLEKIGEERERRSRKINLEQMASSEGDRKVKTPYSVPLSWTWVYFGDITFSRDSERIPLSREVREGRRGEYDYYGASGIIDHIDDYIFDQPLLLIGEDGANLVLRSKPIAFIATGKYWVNNHAHVLDTIDSTMLRYLELYISAINLSPFITGTAQPKMNQTKMNSIMIALPPLPEQHRIVAKVNELFAQTRALAARLEQAQAQRTLVTAAALHRLDTATDDASLRAAWATVSEAFADLYDDSRNIAALRQTILNLAVRGKLVSQDPADEPASVLLELIDMEKIQQSKETGIKAGNEINAIEGDEQLLIPDNWAWTRMGQITHRIHYGYTASATNSIKEYRLLRITDIQGDKVNWDSVPGCDIDADTAHKYLLKKDDILIARTGGTIGKSYLVDELHVNAVFASYLIRIVPASKIDAYYLKIYLGSKLYWDQLAESTKGTGQPNVNATSLSALKLPLPPLPEQHRIVAKVDQLMRLCDALEARLTAGEAVRGQMAAAVLNGVIGSGPNMPLEHGLA